MVKLKINDREFTAKPGETVLAVCEREGISIPKLCYHKELSPYGGCRLCLVEVKGAKNPLAACTLPVQEGMVVTTDTDELKKLRRFSLQLILSEHPHACLICTKQEECASYQECIQKSAVTAGCKFCTRNGTCELQKLVEEFGIKEIPFAVHYRNLPVERTDPFFDRDYNLCILCGRCIRACQEVRRAAILDFANRGPVTRVGTPFGRDHLDADCQFCGACVDVCPTGALSERFNRWEEEAETSVKTACPLCSLGCALTLGVKGNKIVGSTPDENQICVRGRFGVLPLVNHPKRITTPLVRRNNRIIEIGWDEALEFALRKLAEHKNKTGIILSPQVTIGTINGAVHIGRTLGATIAFARPAEFSPIDIKKLDKDGAYIFLNTDMVGDFSVLVLQIRNKGGSPKFIAIDPIETRSAKKADRWLRPKFGGEAALVELLFSRPTKVNKTGIANADIDAVKSLLAGRTVYLVGAGRDVTGIRLPKAVIWFPIDHQINGAAIQNSGIGTTADRVIGRPDINCLYVIGAAVKPARRYETVIVQDLFPPAFDFDLFLPAATFAEIDGTFTDIGGKTKRLNKAVEPVGKSKSDEWIMGEISRRLGVQPAADKIEKIKTRTQLEKKSARTTNRFPFYLTVRPNGYTYRGMPLSSRLRGFARFRNDDRLWINPVDAEKLAVQDGQRVTVAGRTLDCTLPVKITDAVPRGLFCAFENSGLGIMNDQPVRVVCIG